MWLRKAAIAAAVVLCAQSALADGLRISIGGGWGRHSPIISRPGQVGGQRPRRDHHDRHTPREAECARELRADMTIDGQRVLAILTYRTDDCGNVRTIVRFESCHGRRLPHIDDVCIEIDQDCRDSHEELRRIDRDRDSAAYAGVFDRVSRGEAKVTLIVTTCEGTSRVSWCDVRFGGG